MADGFGPDSASLLIQNGYGHCSLAHPSLCTAKKIRAYLLDGKLPEDGTVCDSDEGYLFPHPDKKDALKLLGAEDKELRDAIRDMAEGGITGFAFGV